MLTMFTAFLVGCVGTAMETHKQGMESGLGKEYFIPKKPIDRHFIGCAWSKQFGPIEDPATASTSRVKMYNTLKCHDHHDKRSIQSIDQTLTIGDEYRKE